MPSEDEGLPSDISLTPSEEQLFVLLRDGRVDAEIAVRLGLSNADVKERIQQLANKLGLRDRSELRGLTSIPPERTGEPTEAAATARTKWMVLLPLGGMLFGAIAATALVLAFHSGRSNTSKPGPAVTPVAATATPAASSSQAPTPSTPATVTVGERTLYTLGPFIDVSGAAEPVLASSERESATVVTLAGPGLVLFAAGSATWTPVPNSPPSSNGFVLQAGVDGKRIYVGVQAADDQTKFLYGSGDSVGIYSGAAGDMPTVIVWSVRTTPEGLYERRHVSIDARGELSIDTQATLTSVALNLSTGEALNVSGASKFGPAAKPESNEETERTDCDAATCHVIAWGEILAPVGGTLSCNIGGVVKLRSGAITIDFANRDAQGDVEKCGVTVEPFSVAKGDHILTADNGVQITGEASGGRALGAAAAGDNAVYIGDIQPKFGCPCLQNPP